MIISNEKKFIYLRVPKTGSTSVSVFLYENLPLENSIIRTVDISPILYNEEKNNIKLGYFDNNHNNYNLLHGVHATLDDIVRSDLLLYPIDEYEIYAVCRNPTERFLSLYNMVTKVVQEDILKNYVIFKEAFNLFEASPQTTWLKHRGKLINNVFLYEDITKLVFTIAKKYNVTNVDNFKNYSFRTYNKAHTEIPKKALEFIKIYWDSDFELYDELIALKNQNL